MIDNQDDSFPDFEKLIKAAPETFAPLAVVPMPAGMPAISSLEIARITGKPHNDVLKDIRRILEEAEIGLGQFSQSYLNSQNKEQPCFLLPRRECDLVVSGYSVKYRLAIIDRWHELEAKQAPAPVVNLNDPAFLRGLLADYAGNVLALQTTVSELTPKAEALDRIAGTDGLMNITTAAKTLQIQPKALGILLDSAGWTYRRTPGAPRIPYQSKIGQGFMVLKAYRYTNQVTGEDGVKESAFITPKGLVKLGEILGKRGAA
jgi:phage antirepressor YoqD-like protein